MKYSILKHFREKIAVYFSGDLFSHTRYRLTIFYSVILMLFLLLFMIIAYSVFYAIISTEQKQETTELASQVWVSNQGQFKNIIKVNNHLRITSSNQEAFFYYVVDKNHHFITGNDKMPDLHDKILEKLRGWYPKSNEIKHETLTFSNTQSVYIEITGKAIYDNGKLIGVFFIGRDLSFYYHMFERLFFILAGLSVIFLVIASLVGHFMAKRAMVPIVEAYGRQQEFVADASHELRTPLSVMQSSIEVIEMEEKNNISNFSYNVLLDMKDEIRSMKKLVVDLLTLARSDSGKYGLNYESFDINTVTNQILRTTQALANSRQIKLSLEAPNSLMVFGDKEKLKQLVYILLDNAIKYSNNGGEILISLLNKTMDNHNYLCIKVQDSGIGISPEQHERIFDRFYRDDKNRTRETGGTGLGLAIAKSIVSAHNGRIKVDSVLQKGTTFTIWIPNRK